MITDAIKIYHAIKKFIIPYDTKFKKVRLGTSMDSGYVIANMKTFDALYSYGCDNKFSFETDFWKKYGCQCYLYDHTQNTIENMPKYITFKKEGVSNVKCIDMNTIDSHIIDNGHTNSQNLFLQMDVEGAEWKSLAASKYLTNFSQIVIEFHLRLWEPEIHSKSKRSYGCATETG